MIVIKLEFNKIELTKLCYHEFLPLDTKVVIYFFYILFGIVYVLFIDVWLLYV